MKSHRKIILTWHGKSWNISLNKEGIQGPMNQRSDFRDAKQKCKRLHDEQTETTGEGNKPIPPAQQVRQRLDQQFEGLENTITDLNLVHDGDPTLPPGRRIHLRHRTGSRTATGSQIEGGIRGKRHHGLNSNFSSLFRDVISLAGNLISCQSTEGVDGHTYRAPHFLMHSRCTDLFSLLSECAVTH